MCKDRAVNFHALLKKNDIHEHLPVTKLCAASELVVPTQLVNLRVKRKSRSLLPPFFLYIVP